MHSSKVLKTQHAKTGILSKTYVPDSNPKPSQPDIISPQLEFAARAEQARQDVVNRSPAQFRLLPFNEAATIWLEIKKLHIRRERTLEAYKLYLANLKKFFGEMLLTQIHIGHLLEYQRERRKTACASYVNHETNCLSQLLSHAGLWDLLEKQFRPLPQGNWTPPKVLTAEEEELFFRVASSRAEWMTAYCALVLTNNTSAMGTELRNLQLQNVHLDRVPPVIHIPDDKVKNEFRARVIPLNSVAEAHMRLLWDRAVKLGAGRPDHYLFPFRVKRNEWDVTRPASRGFIRKGFDGMRRASGLKWLQPRNFRNQIITKLFESGAPDETIIAIAGHQSIKMSRYYSRIRVDAKFEALTAVLRKDVKNAG